MLDWRAEQFRLTAFVDEVPGDVWRSVTGEEPDTVTSDRRVGTSEQQGDFRGLRLVATKTPGRFDWRVSAAVAAGASDVPPLQLEEGRAVIDAVAKEFLDGRLSIKRIAFGAILYAPTTSRTDGLEGLAPLLTSVKLDPAGRDFVYQINWPRFSKVVPDLLLNRLTTWQVEERALTSFTIGASMPVHLKRTTVGMVVRLAQVVDLRGR